MAAAVDWHAQAKSLDFRSQAFIGGKYVPAASGKTFENISPIDGQMLAHVAAAAPIRRNVTIEDVGNAAAFLCSDLAAGVTGEVLYVDGGYNSVGMSFPGDAEA